MSHDSHILDRGEPPAGARRGGEATCPDARVVQAD